MTAKLAKHLPKIIECPGLRGKKVLLRTGLNEPMSDDKVTSDFRIKKALPTIELLQKKGAKIIVIAHLSHADGTSDKSLEAVCEKMNEFIPVTWANGILGEDVEEKISQLKEGEVLMLENLRRHEGETSNNKKFAEELASLADVYVNDAFSVSHREHASVVGVPKFLPSYAGLLLIDEIEHLTLAREPKHPSLLVLGGSKFKTKIPLIELFIGKYDRAFIGGALANNFFQAKGYEIGRSLVSDVDLGGSKLIDHPRLILPIDVTVDGPQGMKVKLPTQVEPDEKILDTGPETIEMLKEQIRFVKTILWNGPLGDYEKGYEEHTRKFAQIVADAEGTSIVGGGDTIASIESLGVMEKFDFMSTAGGAMLIFLERGTLPGIEALLKK